MSEPNIITQAKNVPDFFFFFHSQRLGLFELFLAFKCPIDIDQMCLAEKAGAFNCPVDID